MDVVACTPHPGLGTVALRRGARTEIVDLATCRTRIGPTATLPSGARVRITSHSQSIVYRGKAVYTVQEDHSRIPAGAPGPIELFGLSPDRKWILFAIDPQGSASLAADGLTMQVVSSRGGKPRTIAATLAYPDYHAWCGGRLVLTAGGDRIAAHGKRLLVARPPDFRPQLLVQAPQVSFGSVACRGNGIVVQAAPTSTTTMNPRWQLWRLGLDGGLTILDRPPPGWSDDSPRVARDGRIVVVRSHHGAGTLYALGVGPLLGVGRDDGFYGHRAWANVSWSLQR